MGALSGTERPPSQEELMLAHVIYSSFIRQADGIHLDHIR